MPEMIGSRIAKLRHKRGWTQEHLAERIAISRVAVSHIEMGLSTPSERTIALMASVFKCTPQELVEGTTYARAKAERLPKSVACYTRHEVEMELFYRDIAWLDRLGDATVADRLKAEVMEEWFPRIATWLSDTQSDEEKSALLKARSELLGQLRSI